MHFLDHQTDEILCTLENKVNTPAFFNDTHIENIKNLETYDFSMLATIPAAANAAKRNRVIIPDDEGHLREFIILETAQLNKKKHVKTVASYIELKKSRRISPIVLEGQTVNMATDWTLAGTGWQRGITEYAGIRKVTIDGYQDPYQTLKQLASLFGLELRFRIVVEGSRIVGRYVDLIKKRGEDTKKETRIGKDLIGVERIENSDIVTALRVLGPEQEDGQRLIVEVKNEDARKRWSRDGKHLWEDYEPSISGDNTNAERLTELGEAQLTKRINTTVQYTAEAVAMEEVFGYTHEKVRLGDTNRIIDTSYVPPLYLEARVIEIQRSIAAGKINRKYILGDFIEYNEEDLMKTFLQLQILYGQKVIRRDTTPPNPRQGMVWVDTSGELDVIFTWNHYAQKWEKATPTFAEEVGAYDKETVDNKDKSVFDDATWYTDVVSEEKKQEVIDYTNKEVQKRELSILRQDTEPSGTNYTLDQLWLRTTDDVYFKWTGSDWKQITPSLAEMGEKAGLEYVDGQLISKAEKAETYTMLEVDNALNSKVSLISYTTDQEGIVQRFTNAETRITQTEEAITSKVSQISFYEVEGRVSSAESTIIQHASLIESKVNESIYETDRNGIISRLNNAESSITQNANEITQRVRSEEYLIDQNALKSRVSTAESTITQHASAIALRVEKNGVVAAINLSTEGTRILSSKIHIDGNVTFANGYDPTTIEVGGTNILFASDLPFTWAVSNATRVNNTDSNGINSIRANFSGSATNFNIQSPTMARKTTLKQGKKYTLSFEIRGNINTMTYNYLMRTEGANRAFPSPPNFSISTTNWTKISVTQECLWDSETGYVLIGTQDTASGKWFEIRKVQLEESDRASTWAPNPLELKADIDGWKFGNTTEIDGGKIRTNTITASQINVSSLSALSANLGTVIAGSLSGVSISTIGSQGSVSLSGDRVESTNASRIARLSNGEGLFSSNSLVTMVTDSNGIQLRSEENGLPWSSLQFSRINANTHDATLYASRDIVLSGGRDINLTPGVSRGINVQGNLNINRLRGLTDPVKFFLGIGDAQIDMTGGDLRIMRDNNNYVRINNGSIQFYTNGTLKHTI
ncbi:MULTISPECIES: phage tail spike protein [unclassified Sutcliffiella]|uniref:phage tail spike protein n=1 Tax=unclassified Sutcliffiella TaxID=2837532 RepID=UPI0030D0E0D1